MTAAPDYQVRISALPGYSVRFAWAGENSSTLYLKPGERLVVPGYLNRDFTEWGNQKWKFLGLEQEASRQMLRVQCEVDGPLLVQKWNGYEDVTQNANLVLPIVQKIYTGTGNAFSFIDETQVDLAIYNPGTFPAKVFIQAVYDAPLQSVGQSGGIDWSQLVWTGHVDSPGPGGVATSVFAGSGFSVSARGGGGSSFCSARGDFVYTGPQQHCKATVTTTAGVLTNAGFFVKQDGATVIVPGTADIVALGVHVFNFTIAEGVNSAISIIGLTDIAQPNRLFTWQLDNVLSSYLCVFSML